MPPLTRDLLFDDRYQYLSAKDSHSYDAVKDSNDPRDRIIKALLEDKAAASRAAHRASHT